MTTVTAIDQVTTEDAAPIVAPHRISRDPGHDDAEVRFTPTNDGQLLPGPSLLPFVGPVPAIQLRPAFRPGASVRPGSRWGPYPDAALYPDQDSLIPGRARDSLAWVVRSGGIGVDTGKLVKRAVYRRASPAVAASSALTCGRTDPARAPSGTQRIVPFLFADVDDGGADGARTINIYALTASQGWS